MAYLWQQLKISNIHQWTMVLKKMEGYSACRLCMQSKPSEREWSKISFYRQEEITAFWPICIWLYMWVRKKISYLCIPAGFFTFNCNCNAVSLLFHTDPATMTIFSVSGEEFYQLSYHSSSHFAIIFILETNKFILHHWKQIIILQGRISVICSPSVLSV
jgi:hypothetical protein